MILSGKRFLLAVLSLFAVTNANAAEQRGPEGLILGSSVEAAQQHALERGWLLVPLSDNLLGQWKVEGSNLSLYVCDGTVVAILEQLDGDLEEFAALVFKMQLESGKPDVQIQSLPSGIGVISTIDARFDTDYGGAIAQLQSIGGGRTLSVSRWIEAECD